MDEEKEMKDAMENANRQRREDAENYSRAELRYQEEKMRDADLHDQVRREKKCSDDQIF